MITSEVQRTLVKSPPELWAELSDPTALAHHMSELEGIGEIKITKIEPETLVEWEAKGASGSVAIKASGWGTKVTLKVSRELPEAAEAGAKAEAIEVTTDDDAGAPKAEVEIVAGAEIEAETDIEAATETKAEAEAEIEATAESAPAPVCEPESPTLTAAERFAPDFPPSLHARQIEAPPQEEPERVEAVEPPSPAAEPEPIGRRGFFARLRGWGKQQQQQQQAEPEPEQTVEPQPEPRPTHIPWPLPKAPERGQASSEPPAAEAPEPRAEGVQAPGLEPLSEPQAEEPQAPEPETPIEPPTAEPQADRDPRTGTVEATEPSDLAAELLAVEEQVTAALTAVLDRLGAAHHRPFSRA